MVDFPLPLSPTRAVDVPGMTSKDTSCKAGCPEVYENETLEKEIFPSQLLRFFAFSESLIAGFSLNYV